ncbi:EAL domain-containing protein [Paraferrimonas sedimenticola]|uniref:cyclic-guanylate-specific phosphodiesterase n=1 Tax=Paraferrimonas sedimenticola TaxID=375674 RepID=A0AA37RY86_9GAMM|nr:EAL domain-containing protein [Paraferrimonas sedimenticola]GLP97455.1 diguanylate cyclase [Paraferrimonas sedimenticola]
MSRFFALVLAGLLLFVAQPSVSASEFVQRLIVDEHGLKKAQVHHISQDSSGYIWAATEDGVYRISSSFVERMDIQFGERLVNQMLFTSVTEIKPRQYFITTNKALYHFDLDSNTFVDFDQLNPEFQFNEVLSPIKTDKGAYRFGTLEQGIVEIDVDTWQINTVLAPREEGKTHWTLHQATNDKVWVANRSELALYDLAGKQLFHHLWPQKYELINELLVDSKGRQWLTSGQGLFQLDAESQSINKITQVDAHVRAIKEDSSGRLWLSARVGVISWHPDLKNSKHYGDVIRADAGLGIVRSILIDHDGLLWLAGDAEGIAVMIQPKDFVLDTFTKGGRYQLENQVIWSILESEGDLWFGTENGLIQLESFLAEGEVKRYHVLPPGFGLSDRIYDIKRVAPKQLALATTRGLMIFDTEQRVFVDPWTLFKGDVEGLEKATIFYVAQDRKQSNIWWVSASSGLFKIDMASGTSMRESLTRASGESRYPYSTFQDSLDRLWVGGRDLFGYIDADNQFNSMRHLLPKDKLSTAIGHMAQHQGRMLFGGDEIGLVSIDLELSEPQLSRLTQENDCRTVFFIQPTQAGLLVGCSDRLLKFDPDMQSYEALTDHDGLMVKELNEGAYLYRPDLGLMFGSPEGAILVDPDKLEPAFDDSQTMLDSVLSYSNTGQSILYSPSGPLSFGPDTLMLKFNFSVANPIFGIRFPYQYQIRNLRTGVTSKPFVMEGVPSVNVAGLDEGEYRLEFLPLHGHASEKIPFTIDFTIDQHWWRSAWFIALVILTVFVGVVALIVVRQQQLDTVRQMNRAIIQNKDRLLLALKGSGAQMWEWDGVSKRIYLRNGMVGKQQDDGGSLFSAEDLLIHPDDIQSARHHWYGHLKGFISSIDMDIRVQANHISAWRWIRVRGKVVERNLVTNQVIKMAGIYTDITKQRELQSDYSLFAQAFANTSEGMLILNEQGEVQVVNNAVSMVLGYSRDDMVNRNLAQLIDERASTGVPMHKILKDQVNWTGERYLQRAKGQSAPVLINMTYMKDTHTQQNHWVVVFSDITERKRHESELWRLANYDALTHLPNRTLFSQRLSKAIREASASGEKMAMLFLDLDRFKQVNDTYGHNVGDALLVEAARRLHQCTSDDTLICRFGGDEFVILLRKVESMRQLNQLCSQIVSAFNEPFEIGGREFYNSTSIGISQYPQDAEDADSFVKNADLAMYQAKELGRANFQYYSAERNELALQQLKLENDLRKAIEFNEFELVYQPQFEVSHGQRLVGVEALLRWNQREQGYIGPNVFIPIAEQCGLIVKIDRWVLMTACNQAARWQAKGYSSVRMSVNVSGIHFMQPDYVEWVRHTLEVSGLAADQLNLEITEGVLMEDLVVAQRQIAKLKAMGVRVSIDDFGTGYSSLAYLRELQVTALKIDKSFIQRIAERAEDQAIASSIIDLARNLNLEVIAEGIETKAQLDEVTKRGCYQIQGYYFSKPVAVVEVEKRLKQYAQAHSLDHKTTEDA